jgi:small subunit ribosomal protein SAe
MNKYIYDRKSSGVHMFNVQKQWEKIQVAARIIASIPDPSTIIVISS